MLAMINVIFFSIPFFYLSTEDSERSHVFDSRQNMGEELESLRATIEEQHIGGNDSAGAHLRPPHRQKRFLSYPRYVELMVTADAKMARHHGPNLEHYILTIMSVVSKIMFLNTFILAIACRCCVFLCTKALRLHIEGSVVCFCGTQVFSLSKVALFLLAQVTMATYAELITC